MKLDHWSIHDEFGEERRAYGFLTGKHPRLGEADGTRPVLTSPIVEGPYTDEATGEQRIRTKNSVYTLGVPAKQPEQAQA